MIEVIYSNDNEWGSADFVEQDGKLAFIEENIVLGLVANKR